MAIGTPFSPVDVMMGRGAGSGPYLWTGAGSRPPVPKKPQQPPVQMGKPDQPAMQDGGSFPTLPTSTLAPESIRATGSGPFDSAYRQNLATYAGGQFSRPGGSMNFNPTDISTFPGQPTGGGTAPVAGMPQSLMDMALGGQGFSWTPPQPQNTATAPGDFGTLQEWMDQFMRGGRNGRMGSLA